MDRTAFLRRVAVVSCGCLALPLMVACSGTFAGQQNSSTPESVRTAQDTEQIERAPDNLAANSAEADAQQRTARVLLTTPQAPFGLDLVDGSNFNQLRIKLPNDSSASYEVTRLNTPPRIVVDLLGERGRVTKTFETADSELVSRIRVGAYPNKSRLVLDLPRRNDIEHRVEALSDAAGDREIVVTLTRRADDTATVASNTSGSGMINNDEPRAAFLPEHEAIEKTETAEELAAGKVDSQADQPKASVAAQPAPVQLVDLELKNQGPQDNILVARLSASASNVDLKRTAPSEYVLTIQDATLSDKLSAPILAPAGTGAIRSIRPLANDGNVALRIFTTPDNNLLLSGAGNKLIVQAARSIEDEQDLRAQPKVEKLEKAADKDAEAKDKAKTAEASDDMGVDLELNSLLQEQPKYTGRLISLDLQDTDIDNALRIIAEVSNLNIIASDDVTGKVTLRLNDVPWDQALDVILKTNGLDKVQEGNVVRIAPIEKLRQEREALKQARQADVDLEDLSVRYVRVSYAKAAELKPLIETVLSERGSVTYDERTNQLIVKDIKRGIKNVAELVAKLDLRTPQVLLETQIVEATRSMARELGSELGFNYVASPATGNATGWNFPNSIGIGGSAGGAMGSVTTPVVAFPAAVSGVEGSAISIMLDSADGTRGLLARLSALEKEGRIRIVSRPSVATTNNTAAEIKSVETIYVKTPSGGLSVATGQGASANGGSGGDATEKIDVGITLKVTPQASPDYYVLMDIDAESSTFGSHPVDQVPSVVKRSAKSSVLVSSGQTFALGGIYKITDQNFNNGVPFLKDVPVLGHLFRWTKVDNSDEELIFFLTPRIIEGSFDDAAMKASL